MIKCGDLVPSEGVGGEAGSGGSAGHLGFRVLAPPICVLPLRDLLCGHRLLGLPIVRHVPTRTVSCWGLPQVQCPASVRCTPRPAPPSSSSASAGGSSSSGGGGGGIGSSGGATGALLDSSGKQRFLFWLQQDYKGKEGGSGEES